ncbi:hypothetical protein BVI434_1170032 [Burkholderia vietnamiensis]|nr:hypothetical protein BVI434_1170032 [Burkholderia vietnamiensis]
MPADGAGARGDLADGEPRRGHAAHDDDDGRPDRRAPQPDLGELAGDAAFDRMVREQRDPHGARELSGRRPSRVSGLPAAYGLRRDEPGTSRAIALGLLSEPAARRRGRRRSAPPVLRRVQRGARHGCRVLPRDDPRRVPGIPACRRHVGRRRRARAPAGHQAHGADDDRGRTRRHLGQRPDPRRARAVHGHSAGRPPQPDRREMRPLRDLLGPPLAHDHLSAVARLHSRARSRAQARRDEDARQRAGRIDRSDRNDRGAARRRAGRQAPARNGDAHNGRRRETLAPEDAGRDRRPGQDGSREGRTGCEACGRHACQVGSRAQGRLTRAALRRKNAADA